MSGQYGFAFMSGSRRRPAKPERLFLALFPDRDASAGIDRLARRFALEAGLSGQVLARERFHVSLLHLGDRKRVRSADVYAAELAARPLRIPAFGITLGRMGSFPGMPKKGRPLRHPLVLLADDGPVFELHAALGAELRRYGFHVPDQFRPHLTLSYNGHFVPMRRIEPVRVFVEEFVLVHSRLWLTEYEILRRWPLDRPPPEPLLLAA